MAASTLNAIFRDVYLLSQHIIDPIEYVRLTNGSDIILQFRDIDIPTGSTADVVVIRPDGTGIQNEADVIVEPGNVVGIEVTDTMFSVLGTSYLQVRITHDDSVIVNFAIPVHVRENYTEGDYPPSENEGGFFDDAKEAVADANAAADSANKAAADANAAADAANQAAEDANTALEDLPNEYYMLTSGTEISGNVDMDTYKTPGNYYIKGAPTSSPNNVQNAPFNRAFTLKVEYANGTDAYIMQTYRVWNTGEKAVRVFSDNAWGAYQYFSPDDALVAEKEFDELHTSEKTIAGAINSLLQPITPLTSRDNLNNITTPGRYTGGSYVPNSPFSGSYDLEVIRATDGIAQSFFCTDTGERAFRLETDGAWSEYYYFSNDKSIYKGVEIQPETDLNTLTTPGVYYSPASTVTATLINMPEIFGVGFAFHVYYVGFTVVQLMIPSGLGGCIFTRSKTVSAWQKWHKYTNDDDLEENMLSRSTKEWSMISENDNSCLVSFTTDTVFGDITIPKYSKGIYIKTAGGDAIVLAYGIYYELYAAFRNNGVWSGSVFTDDAHLNVGGRNLLLNTGDPIDGFTTYQGSSFSRANVTVPGWNTEKAVRLVGTSGTGAVCVLYNKNSYGISIEGQKYVTSVYVKNNHASKNVIVNSNIKTQLTDPVVIEPGETKRAVLFSQSLGTAGLQINFSAEAANTEFDFSVWHMQIEEGDVVTDWTPAPEDYENDFPDWASTVPVPALLTSNKTLAGAINDTMRNSYSLTGGTAIPKNADMDSYKARGNYYCESNANAATLKNSPFSRSFTLKIEYAVGTSYPMQIYRAYDNGNKAVRIWFENNDEWGGYYYYTNDNQLLSATTFSALQTTAKTIIGAINEVNTKAGSGGGGSVIDKQVFDGTTTVTSNDGVQIQNAISFQVKGSGESGTDKSQGTALITVNGGGIYYLSWTGTNDILDAKLSTGAAFQEDVYSIVRDGPNIIVRFTKSITHAISVYQ